MVLSQADRMLIDYCRALSSGEFIDLVNKLGREKKLRPLRIIGNSDLQNAKYAVGVLTAEMDGVEAVAFCKKLPLGSPKWRSAFWNLDAHRKVTVIDYIKEVSRSPDSNIRYICYSLCVKAGWGDLLEQAKKDVGNTTPITQPGTIVGETLGRVAALYVDVFEH
jgi:hypothetical protein